MNKRQHARMMEQIRQHGENLLKIYPHATEKDPVKLCKKLRKIEVAARKYATDYCNGDITPTADYANIEAFDKAFLGQVSKILGNGPAVMLNHDCRGYALKIDSDKMGGVNLYRDMGGYGIIAPEFDGN